MWNKMELSFCHEKFLKIRSLIMSFVCFYCGESLVYFMMFHVIYYLLLEAIRE